MKHSPEVIKTEIWKSDSECKDVTFPLIQTGMGSWEQPVLYALFKPVISPDKDMGGYSRGRESSWEGNMCDYMVEEPCAWISPLIPKAGTFFMLLLLLFFYWESVAGESHELSLGVEMFYIKETFYTVKGSWLCLLPLAPLCVSLSHFSLLVFNVCNVPF